LLDHNMLWPARGKVRHAKGNVKNIFFSTDIQRIEAWNSENTGGFARSGRGLVLAVRRAAETVRANCGLLTPSNPVIEDNMPHFAPILLRLRRAHWLSAALLASACLLPAPAGAGTLPVAVDGQPLPSLAPMLAQVMPAVVNINSRTRVRVRNPLLDDPFFRQFFGMQNVPRERIEQSLGSGVIIDAAKGYVLTNNHVIEGADDIAVTLHDGRTLKAQVVGTDPDTDIAVIRIPAQNLSALPLADSSKLRVGDFVVALGDPFGLGQTVTSGIVSALDRNGLRGMGYQNFIQTDASINPGNSGGALVNLRGELVGINSAIYSPSGGNVGIGFAIPTNLARQIMQQLIATGTVVHASLGLQAQDISPDIAQALGVNPGAGAVVTRVRAGSPAEAAGIQAGDVVLSVGGKPIHSATDLQNAQGILPVGTRVELQLVRDGQPVHVQALLRAAPSAKADGERLDARLGGAQLSEVAAGTSREGLAGVRVNRVASDSRAAHSGLKPGDLIIGVNQIDIAGLDDLHTLLRRYPRQVLLSVVRGRDALFVPLR
jgi:Do/DeqQ family serine protease